MRTIITLIVGMFLIFPIFLFSGTKGTIEGKVVDENGKPLAGAKVFVEGPQKSGAYVKKTGYRVINLDVGTYIVTASFVGKNSQKKQVTLSADMIMTVDFKLEPKSSVTKGIVVVAKRGINRTQVEIQDVITQADRDVLPSNSTFAVVAQSAGVQSGGGGFQIRGSRANQTTTMVDGMDVGSAFSGGVGALGTGNYAAVSSDATEEVQVKRGGQGAEYGGTLGGTINTQVKTGNVKRFEGFFNWATDMPSLYGYQKSGLDFEFDKNEGVYNPIEKGPGLQLQGSNYNQFEFGFGGPMGFSNSTFYLSGNNIFSEFGGASYKVLDPDGMNIGHLENDGKWVKNITARMKFQLTDVLNVVVGGTWGNTNLEQAAWRWAYRNDNQIFTELKNGVLDTTGINKIPERIIKQNVRNQDIVNAQAVLNHTLADIDASYELAIRYSENNSYSARRLNDEAPGYFTGFELTPIVDNVEINPGELSITKGKSDFVNDYYQSYKNAGGLTADGFRQAEIPINNPISGYIEGETGFTTQNPYGIDGLFVGHGSPGYSFRQGTFVQLDGKYNQIVEFGKAKHAFKTGFQFTSYNAQRHFQGSPSNNDLTQIDVYSDKSEWANIYTDNPETVAITSQPKTPYKFNVFFQDQIRFNGLIMTPGLRIDYHEPNSKYRTLVDDGKGGLSFHQIRFEDDNEKFAQADAKLMISPRFNINFPISETQEFTFNYGIYYKMPDLNPMFDFYNLDGANFTGTIGDPNVKPERANTYQFSYAQDLTDDLFFRVTGFQKDIYNELGVIYIKAAQPYYKYAVTEYGYNRGGEVEVRKRLADNYEFKLNYTLASAKGTADGQTSNRVQVDRSQPDLPEGFSPFPQDVFTLGRSITHTLNLNASYQLGKEEGLSIGDIYPFENLNIGTSTVFLAGRRYTVETREGRDIQERNTGEAPNYYQTDLKINKRFKLNDFMDWFSENQTLDIYFNIFNVFNFRDAVGVYAYSGDPLYANRIFEIKQSDDSPTPYYKEALPNNATTRALTQYDNYGNRLYNERADLDGNGQVEQEEKYKQKMEYYKTLMKGKGNFQVPIRVAFGIKLRF